MIKIAKMPKRKADSLREDVGDVKEAKKHSLDSDEEDDNIKKYEIMEDDDVEGQEDGTIDFDGDIKITPFNIKEELEEGHFDKDGNYFLNKDEEIKDSWLDNIDWVKVKAQEKPKANVGLADSESEDESEAVDASAVIKQIIQLMNPGETVLKAIKRLGNKSGNKGSASSRWLKNKKKAPNADAAEAKQEESENLTEKMLALTGLADKLLNTGRMEIYSETFEKLKYEVEKKEKIDNEPLDMFGDDFKESDPKPESSQPEASTSKNSSSEVLWEFKWENADGVEVYGPHTTTDMQRWVEDGYFKDGVWVRRANETNSQFYSSKRVDFELYL